MPILGQAWLCLVIGGESLSRVVDHRDRDSMIYSDGVGATLLEAKDGPRGILATKAPVILLPRRIFFFLVSPMTLHRIPQPDISR